MIFIWSYDRARFQYKMDKTIEDSIDNRIFFWPRAGSWQERQQLPIKAVACLQVCAVMRLLLPCLVASCLLQPALAIFLPSPQLDTVGKLTRKNIELFHKSVSGKK